MGELKMGKGGMPPGSRPGKIFRIRQTSKGMRGSSSLIAGTSSTPFLVALPPMAVEGPVRGEIPLCQFKAVSSS
jgi:hypothetical protein